MARWPSRRHRHRRGHAARRSARRRCYERWAAGVCGIADGEGRCREFDADRAPLGQGGAARRPLHAARAGRLDRGARRRRLGRRAALRRRAGSARSSAPASAASARSRPTTCCSFEQGPKHVSPLAVPLMMGNAAAAAVSMRHGLRGLAFGTMSACSSGADAIGTAMRAIACGDADRGRHRRRRGGADAALAGRLRARSTRSRSSGISRPFDARRDGFVMGEGAGVLVLENGDAARARGARILALLRGYGATADAHHVTAPDPAATGAARGDRARARGRRRRPARTSSTSTPTAPRRRSTTAPRRSR